jgi:PAS domain S-box-containing protein
VGNKRIVIVEDEGIIALQLKSALEQMGHTVVAAYASGEDALAGIKTAKPDLALMDIKLLGEMDGIETADYICKEYDIPVIFLTAHSEDGMIERAKATGPYGYLLKPVSSKELTIAVELAAYKHKIDKEKEQLTQKLRKSEKNFRDITSALGEGIYVLNDEGDVTFMNPEAERLLGWTTAELVNKNMHDMVHSQKADGTPLSFEDCPVHAVTGTGKKYFSEEELFKSKDGTLFPVSVISTPLMCEDRAVASITAFRDITVRKQLEKDREKLISELQEALQKVKLLSGLLPICASCKKIRDDKGYWNQIESYIKEHSEAEFSHAICPECGKKLYPQYYDKVWGKKDK